MSLNTTADRVTAAGDGVTTAFSFPYNFLANADLKVYLVLISTGVETLKILDTDYTVSGAGVDGGGTVTFLAAPSALYRVLILRDTSLTQEVAIGANGKISSAALEDQLDKLTMMVQRLKNKLARAIVLPEGNTETLNMAAPALAVPDGFFKLDADGEAIEYLSLTDLYALMAIGITLTASRVIVTDSSGVPVVSDITSAQLLAMLDVTVGTKAAPTSVVAANGVLFTSTAYRTTNYIKGSSAGANVVSAGNRIAAGTIEGQLLTLIGCNDADYVDLQDGGLISTGGQTIRLKDGSVAVFRWNNGTSIWNLVTYNQIM